MKSLFLNLLLLMAAPAWAEITTVASVPSITFTSSGEYSCKIFRRRVEDVSKGYAGLHALVLKLKQKKGWSDTDARRLQSVFSKIREFPSHFYARSIRVTSEWPVDEVWSEILNRDAYVRVRWQFKGEDWQDEKGILPDDVASIWLAQNKKIRLELSLSPVELCYGSTDLRLTISRIDVRDQALELQAKVQWR